MTTQDPFSPVENLPEAAEPDAPSDAPIVWSTSARVLFALLTILALVGGVIAGLLVVAHYPTLASTARYRTFGILAPAPPALVVLLFTLFYRGKRS